MSLREQLLWFLELDAYLEDQAIYVDPERAQ